MSEMEKYLITLSPAERILLLKKIKQQKNNAPQMQIQPQSRNTTIFPLSFAQEQLWFLAQLEPDSPLYNLPTALFLDGPLDMAALAHSLQELVNRHEVLRTCFVTREGQPLQHIAAHLALPLPLVELSTLPEAQRERLVPLLTQQYALLPFDLSRLPLIRAMVLRLGDQQHVLLLTMHHSISDGWSMEVLFRELSVLYTTFRTNQPSPLTPLPLQYADYALWQKQWLSSPAWEEHLAYWKSQLATLPPLSLLTDRPRPAVQRFRGQTFFFTCSPALTQALKRLSQQENVTLFMTLLAAFQFLLARYSGQEDFAIGTPVANRTRRELEALIGFFVNTLVLRADLSGNPTVRALLKRVRESTLQAFAHQEMPFEKLVEVLNPPRSLSQHPLIQVMFGMQNMSGSPLELDETAAHDLPVSYEMAKFDLSLDLAEQEDTLLGAIEYDSDLFERSTIERLVGHYQQVLQEMTAGPDKRLSLLPLLTPPERLQILEAWNATQSEYPHALCLHHLFEEQVARTPEAVALVFEEQMLTYNELNRRANQLAHYLQRLGVGPEVVVGICMERCIEMVVALLAVLKAEGAYVPLDPTYPQERLTFIAQDAHIAVLLTQQRLVRQVSVFYSQVIVLEQVWQTLYEQPAFSPAHTCVVENLAYIIYTSGSTGMPKGVLVTHRGLGNLALAHIKTLRLGPDCRVLQLASLNFDVSVCELLIALLAGGSLHLARAEQLAPGSNLLHILREQSITVMLLTPTVLALLPREPLPALQTLVVGGDTFPVELMAQWAQGRSVFNAYGPTEATVCVSLAECSVEQASLRSLSLGAPLANMQLYLLDQYLQPVPVGVAGEIFLGGRGLARGYLHMAELTAERFVPHPFSQQPGARLYRTGDLARFLVDGHLEFLGRNDQQVKLRGIRIELGEIEAVLRQHPAVREALVLAQTDTTTEQRLVAYIVGQVTAALTTSALRQFLQVRLPNYMIPAAFVVLDAFPLTPNGKVDRRALPLSGRGRAEREEAYVEPRTPLEERIAALWSEGLGIEHVGIFDNFFALGGHSLLAARLVAQISTAFQVSLSVQLFFATPTIIGIAEVVQRLLLGERASETTPDEPDMLIREALLPPEINTTEQSNHFPETPSAILLTGATGFVGVHLLAELLQATQADVYCLVRAASVDEGRKKIEETLRFYLLWYEQWHTRIMPVPGDLAQPGLGLVTEHMQYLAQHIEVIYHCGAAVNFLYPYHLLKPGNVLGTQEILRFACLEKVKPVHFISTLSVFPAVSKEPRIFHEDEPLEETYGLTGGYEQSKWVADKLVLEAGRRGIPVSIYRLGLVGGHSQTGRVNLKDLLWAQLKGCIQMKATPSSESVVSISPVDYICKAIVFLSQQEESVGKAFHLSNAQATSWQKMIAYARSCGYVFEEMNTSTWKDALQQLTEDQQENALVPFLGSLEDEYSDRPLNRIEDRQTQNALRRANLVCLASEALLPPYFAYLMESGFLPEPASDTLIQDTFMGQKNGRSN